MVDEYEAAWRSLRRRRLLCWGSWLGAMPFIMGANALSFLVRNTGLSNGEVLPLFALVAGGFMGGGIAVGAFRCPRCANRFCSRGLIRNPFTRRCVHCQLRTGTPGSDPSAAVGNLAEASTRPTSDKYVETFRLLNEKLKLDSYVHRPSVRRAMVFGALLIAAACIPLLIVFITFISPMLHGQAEQVLGRSRGPSREFLRFWFATMAYVVVGLFLVCAYGVHVVTNRRLAEAQQAKWLRAIAFVAPLGMLAYGYLHLRRPVDNDNRA
jgi:hypothetical protein